MILYAIEYKGELSNYDWSIVTIWNNQDSAKKEMNQYISNYSKNEGEMPEYRIKEIDTDKECVYDCEEE